MSDKRHYALIPETTLLADKFSSVRPYARLLYVYMACKRAGNAQGGIMAKKKLTTSQKLSHCVGCHDNYYNSSKTSGAGDGLCWSIHNAELILRKEVHVDQRPPWKQKPRKFLSCYHRPKYCYMSQDVDS